MSNSESQKSRRQLTLLFALLYFSEGAPIGFIWWALPTLLRKGGVEVDRVTSLMAALVLPWTLKFLWAPVVDAVHGPRWRRRYWIAAAQISMGLCLLPLCLLDPANHFGTWVALLVVHAFFAATQDVAIDALAVRRVTAEDRGAVNGAMQAGMLLGRSLFGGVSILLVTRWGWTPVFAGLVAAIWMSLAALWLAGRDLEDPWDGEAGERGSAWRSVLASLGAMVRKRTTWFAAGFALTGGAAFETAGALAGPYLIDQGAASDAIGFFFSLPSVAAMLVGGLIGGRISDRVGRVRSVAIFLLLTTGGVLALAALPAAAPNMARFAVLTFLYAGVGFFTAASYAMFMDASDPEAGGTQFSAFMAATNGCEAWAVWAGGRLAGSFNYQVAFLAMAAVSIAAVGLFLPRVRLRR